VWRGRLMATLDTLQLLTFTNISLTAITGTEPVLQEIASADDNTNVHDTSNTTHTGTAQFTLENVNSDLGNMDTLFIRLRYAWQSGTQLNAWSSLTARVFKSDGTTPLTDLVTVASGITTTTPTNSSVVQFAGVDTAAIKADWDAAVVQVGFVIAKNMAGDALEERVFAAEITGTYTPSVSEPEFLVDQASEGDSASDIMFNAEKILTVEQGQESNIAVEATPAIEPVFILSRRAS